MKVDPFFYSLLLKDINNRALEFASEFTLEALQEMDDFVDSYDGGECIDRESFINFLAFEKAVIYLSEDGSAREYD